MTTKLKILQWNMRSMQSNKHNLVALIHKHAPEIILLNETWLKSSSTCYVKNYNVIRVDKPNNQGGGIATLVHKNIRYKIIEPEDNHISNEFQYLIIKILNVNIINMYSHPRHRISKAFLENTIRSLEGSIIWMGDLNSHNPIWGSNHSNNSGNVIAEVIMELNLVTLNDGTTTRLQLIGQSPSIIDLTIVSNNIASDCHWMKIEDVGCSDHFPTICKYNIKSNNQLKITASTDLGRNFKKADWNQYENIIWDKIQTSIWHNQAETNIDNLIHIMGEAANIAVPKKIYNPSKTYCPWWDEECSVKIKLRKEALKNFKNSPSTEAYIETKRVIASTRRFFKQKKKSKFKKFCESINRETEVSKIWKTIKKFSRVNMGNGKNSYIDNNTANQILDKLTAVDINMEFNLSYEESKTTFTYTELMNSLGKKDTTPGNDDIPYSMLNNLPTNAKHFLLKIFNQCIAQNFIPETWKTQIIVPIVKQGKDGKNAENYRGIALAPCIAKTFETMIKNKIEWIIEHNNKLPHFQTGFRKGKGTNDNIALLTTFTQLAFSKNQSVIGIFLDIKSAYDHVNLYKLYDKLKNLQIPTDIANIVFNLFNNRKLYIRKETNELIGPKVTWKGLAQGSSLSPLLFNIYMIHLHQIIPDEVMLLSYADDLVLLGRDRNMTQLTRILNRTLEEMHTWLMEHDLELALQKCEAVWFTKGHNLLQPPPIIIGDHTLRYVSEIKHLGVILNHNLRWENHIEQMCIKARKGINILKMLCGVWWGADPVSLKLAFGGIVRAHLDFGAIFIRPTTKKNQQKLNSVHNQALRTITGCMKSTPINALLSECGEMDLESRRTWLAKKFLLKSWGVLQHPLVSMLQELDGFCRSPRGYWEKRDIPYLVTAFQELSEYNNIIEENSNLPCFETDYYTQLRKIKVLKLGIGKESPNPNAEFLGEMEKHGRGYTLVYTDGSKNNENVGYGVHIPQLNINFSSRLSDHMSICSAELAAIHKAICICKEKKVNKAIICSDSKSAIEKISNCQITKKNGNNVLKIKERIREFNNENNILLITWIPGHAKIVGNEMADKLAKIGTTLNIAENTKVEKSDILAIIKNNTKDKFKSDWKNKYHTGKWYTNIQENFDFKPWHFKFPYSNRRHVTSIIRMRTGHCLTGEHLHKIKIREHPYCDCGQIESLDHIFFECPISKINNFDLYTEIIKIQKKSPINMQVVLRDMNKQSIKLILDFINYNRIEI